jgi:hypothetical protein
MNPMYDIATTQQQEEVELKRVTAVNQRPQIQNWKKKWPLSRRSKTGRTKNE